MPPRPRKRRLEVAEALRAMDTPDVGPQAGTSKVYTVVAPAPVEPTEGTNVQVPVTMPPRSRKRRREVAGALRAMATPDVGSRATARTTRQWYLSRRNHCHCFHDFVFPSPVVVKADQRQIEYIIDFRCQSAVLRFLSHFQRDIDGITPYGIY
ncbi:hypothetical protein DPMN_062798 [Dreissena polymorpha]|uniref:Uncharacterized protein n=1 Tax=Dreissena polymorpha TaxID=45954 RepID=A0A9D4HJK5_DREPO|nr:hypothetical protein DPMN_062798 [Dreissena polymorpha]